MAKLTPENLKKKINEYFEECGTSTLPDDAGMLLYLDLMPEEVSDLCDGDDAMAAKFRRVFKYAELRRESWLSRLAVSDSKLSSGAFNLLKQQKNGGYTSASTPNKASEFRIIWDKAGGAEAFK